MTAIDLLYGDAAAAREIVDQFQPAMTKDAYLVLQRGLLKTRYARQRINRRGRDWLSPSRSIGLRIAKEIEPGAVGLFLIGAVMTLQTEATSNFSRG